MRFFIALEIPDTSKDDLLRVQTSLGKLLPNFKPTDLDKLHLTIAFVGEQPETLKEPLVEVIAEAVKNVPPFTVTPGYIDGFPHLHSAHVLWIGVKGDVDKLFLVRHRIKDGLQSLKLNVDDRRFIPHIALGNTSNLDLTASQENELERIEQENFDPIQVDSIKLFDSVPNLGFHEHNTLAEIKLS